MEGVKNNNNKIQMSKLFTQFPDALKAVMLASTFGHIKYEEFDEDWLNYQRVVGKDMYVDAMNRHQCLQYPEQEESKLPPKFHVAWNSLADLQMFIDVHGVDVDELAKINIPVWKEEFKR